MTSRNARVVSLQLVLLLLGFGGCRWVRNDRAANAVQGPGCGFLVWFRGELARGLGNG